MSTPRPDPSSPSAVAAAAFTTSRRGYEQSEVREFLRMVAAEIARLQEREGFLERELHTAQRTAPSAIALDDELVTRMLGEEATRVLQTAREAAAQIKSRAEEGAARLVREATDDVQRMREEVEVEVARKRNDAAADAEAELQMAKQQGRDMVNEARDYRERVLGELARRRELARQQIEQLVHGRERLLQAFERARLVSIDVMAELTPLGQPEEYVDLSPTTGPVPVIVASNAIPSRTEPGLDIPLDDEFGADLDDHDGDGDHAEAGAIDDRDEADATSGELDDVGTIDDDQVSEVGQLDQVGEVDLLDEVERAIDDEIERTLAVDDEAADAGDVGIDDADVAAAHADDRDDADRETDDLIDATESFEMIATVDVVDATGEVQHFDLSSTIERLQDVGEAMAAASSSAEATDPTSSDADDEPEASDVAAGGASVRLDIAPAPQAEDELDDDDQREPARVVSLFGDADRTTRPPERARTSVDELFARLRASRTDAIAQRAAAAETTVAAVTSELASSTATDEGRSTAPSTTAPSTPAAPNTLPAPNVLPAPNPATDAREDSVFLPTPDAPPVALVVDDSPFARRDEALTPIIVAAARRLKRVLADEQNEVLHALRRSEPVRSIDVLIPAETEHEARYGSAIDTELLDAALAGAGSMGVEPADVRREFVRTTVTATARDVLATELIRPLRDRIERAVLDADGDNPELANLVRTVYREWKNQRIDEQLDDVVQTAFGRGALAAVPGTPIRWIVDPNGPACPDAEDNALGGVVIAGEPFPTDHRCAPAHSGCGCMIVPAPESSS